MLELRIAHRVNARFRLDVAIASQAKRLGIFGPSGAGKSSLLQCVAGILRPREARIRCDATVWQDTADGAFTPAHRRHIGYMTQDPLLFPHITVEQNLRYSRAGAAATTRFRDVVEALDLGPLLGRMPRGLSGGEQQRTALGRALLSDPLLLLLDEPFTGLDAHSRRAATALLDRVHRQFHVPCVLVSHRGADLVTASDEVIVLRGGRVVAQGDPLTCLAAHSDNPAGLGHDIDNILRGPTRPVPEDPGLAHLEWGGRKLIVPAPARPEAEAAYGCYANSLVLSLEEPARQSARNHLPARVTALRPLGTTVMVDVVVGDEQLRALVLDQTVREMGLSAGAAVWVNAKATALTPLR